MDRVKPDKIINGRCVSITTSTFVEWWSDRAIPRGLLRQNPPALPDGWELVFFSGRQDSTGKDEVKVHISYTQPHLPGNVSAYLPLLPPEFAPDNARPVDYLITFRAYKGVRFAPVDQYDVVGQPTDTQVSIRPVNLQLLKMQITSPSAPPDDGSLSQIPPAAPATRITKVAFSGEPANYRLTVDGTGLGHLPNDAPFTGVNPYFRKFEVAQIGAGEWGYPGDAKLLRYESWSDTQIQIGGLSARPGDAIQIWASNPATGASATWGGNVPDGAGNPRIDSVNFSGSGANLHVTVNGSGFGDAPVAMPFTGDLDQFIFADQRAHSGAGAFEAGGQRWRHGQPDAVTVKYQSWSDNQIVIDGFAGAYP
jgi:hypothetical protein